MPSRWLGNTSASDDDTHAFYDRSLGTIHNGTATDGPYQLKTANNQSTGSARTGKIETTYDAAGYLGELTVHRAGTCVPAGKTYS